MRTIKIKADTYRQDYNYRECKQNDDIPLEVTLLEGGVELDLSGYTITLNWIKSDNTVVTIAGDTIKVIGNIVSLILPRDCTRAVGQAKFELVITDNTSKQISTFPLSLEIIGSVIQGQQASNNVATLTEELNNANIAAINTKNELKDVIDTADLTTYASQGQMQEVNSQLADKMKKHWINIKDFGAKGDGITDDTISIQNAIDYAFLNKIPLYVPSGIYNHTGLNLYVDGILEFSVFGDGILSILKYTLTSGNAINIMGSDVSRIKNCSIQDLRIVGQKDSTAIGINTSYLTFSNFNRVYVEEFSTGILLGTQCYGNEFNRCVVKYCSAFGIKTGNFAHWNVFIGCQIQGWRGNTNIGLQIESNADYESCVTSILNCDFEGFNKGLEVRGGLSPVIEGCYFEKNISNHIRLGWSDRVLKNPKIKNSYFSGGLSDSAIDLYVDKTYNAIFENLSFNFDALELIGIKINLSMANARTNPSKVPTFKNIKEDYITNNATSPKPRLNFENGQEITTISNSLLLNNWVNNDDVNYPVRIIKHNNVLTIEGSIKGGTPGYETGKFLTMSNIKGTKLGRPVMIGLTDNQRTSQDLTLELGDNSFRIRGGTYNGSDVITFRESYVILEG